MAGSLVNDCQRAVDKGFREFIHKLAVYRPLNFPGRQEKELQILPVQKQFYICNILLTKIRKLKN